MELPNFERVTRRALLRQGLTVTGGLAAATALLAACSKSDSETFSTQPVESTASPSSSTDGTPASGAPSIASAVPSAGSAAAVQVSFAYRASSGGQVRNSYVAVWVEDRSRELAALVGVWYSTRDARYLGELTSFTGATAAITSAQVDAVSGATRSAGDYTLQWDGRGLDGTPLDGRYTLWVEAAREHGPHSVTSGSIDLGTPTNVTIAGNGELSEIRVSVA